MNIKSGDTVKILRGKDKGREGTVARVFPKKEMVLVPGINMYKKHIKKEIAADGKGGVYELPRPLHWSKVKKVESKKAVAKKKTTKTKKS